MSSSETPDITVDEDGLADPNFDGYFNGKEAPQEILQVDEEKGLKTLMPIALQTYFLRRKVSSRTQ
jgi:hypothetical protein